MSGTDTLSSSYQLVPTFQVRTTGVPFDALTGLATPGAVAAARETVAKWEAVARTVDGALEGLRAGPSNVGLRKRDKLRRAIGMQLPIDKPDAGLPESVRAYAAAHSDAEAQSSAFECVLEHELNVSAAVLHQAARRYIAGYAVFASPSLAALVSKLAGEDPGAETWDPKRDRHLLLYLQRLATKNETFSAFGPSAWGSVKECLEGIALSSPRALRRHAYLERWVAEVVVSAMNRDPATRAEVAPRVHPCGYLEGPTFCRLDTGGRVTLEAEEVALVRACNGGTPAHALNSPARLAKLAEAGVLIWAVECPALVADRISELLSEVRAWRDCAARGRWEPILAALAALPEEFADDQRPAARCAIMKRASQLLESIEAVLPAPPQRVLYRATNPIGEECVLDVDVHLGRKCADGLATRAAPWLDLWRDTVAFAAHRANEKLRALHAKVGQGSALVPLPSLLAAAEAVNLSLPVNGVPALAYLAFQEVNAVFRAQLESRLDQREVELSADDCGVVRRCFVFPQATPFAYPSADLQVAAKDLTQIEAGEHRWVIAELHGGAVALQHGIYWGCPDRASFDGWVRTMASGPTADWGFAGADLATHTTIHYEALGDLFTYLGPSSASRPWATARSAEALVYVTDDGDVRLRVHGRDCGSFARSWVLPLGLHPFVFSFAPHTPRLTLCGVVVQRETWTINLGDMPHAPYRKRSAFLVSDADRLRESKAIPRYIYIRPTQAAVRRLGAGGRDKDVKPVFIDLESYPFLEVLARWMAKHRELEVVEMLPAPDDLPWRTEEGRYTFELRTLLAPRGASRGSYEPSNHP